MKKLQVGSKEFNQTVSRLMSLKLPPLSSLPPLSPVSSSIYIRKKTFTGDKNIDIEILTNLGYEDLLNTCQTNKYISELCKNNMLWRNKLSKDFPLRSKYLYNPEYIEYFKTNPRKLYEIIKKPSKIITIKKKDYTFLFEAMPDDDSIVNDELKVDLEMEDLTGSIKSNHKVFYSLPLLRGDVIYFDWMDQYRNDGKVIWDGEQTQPLDYTVDDYGSIPKTFTFPEFPLNHFYESIDHNTIIWLSANSIEEAIRNFDEKTQSSSISDSYKSYVIKFDEEVEKRYSKDEFIKAIRKKPIVVNDENLEGHYIFIDFNENEDEDN